MSICPEHEYRESLPEDEFWMYVLRQYQPDSFNEDDEPPELSSEDLSACTICHSYGACGYDSEGRPLIHLEDDRE